MRSPPISLDGDFELEATVRLDAPLVERPTVEFALIDDQGERLVLRIESVGSAGHLWQIELAEASSRVEVDANRPNDIRLVCEGGRCEVSVNGQTAFAQRIEYGPPERLEIGLSGPGRREAARLHAIAVRAADDA